MLRNTQAVLAHAARPERMIWKSAVQARTDFSGLRSSQGEVLLPQGKQNCFLGVRNKKRLEVDFNLGT